MTLSASFLNRARFYLLLLVALALPGCAILGGGTRAGVRDAVPELKVERPTADRPAPQMAGTAIRWRAAASGGAGKITYSFEMRPGILWMAKTMQAGHLSEWSWTPAKAGHYRVRVVASDARGNRARSDWSDPYEIAPKLTVKPPSVDLKSPRAAGTAIRWTAVARGGVGETAYQFEVRPEGGAAAAAQSGTSPGWLWRPEEAGRYQARVVAIDARGNRAESSWSVPYEIAPKLAVRPPAVGLAAPQTAGTAILWTAAVSGGVGKYTSEFRLRRGEGKAATVQSGPAPEWLWRPEESGSYQVQVVSVDAHGNRAESEWSDSYEVVPSLAVKTLEVNRTALQAAGTAIRWMARTSGGVGEITYTFELRSEGEKARKVQAGASPEWHWMPAKAGRYQVRVVAADVRGNRTESGWSEPFEIVPKLTVTALPPSLPAPQAANRLTITWNATATGGVGERTYRYLLRSKGGSEAVMQAGPSPTWDWQPTEAGSYRVSVAVSDSLGNEAASDWSAPYEIIPLLPLGELSHDQPSPQMVGASPITWQVTTTAEVAEKLTYEFLLRRDRGKEVVVQKGDSPTWQWVPAEPGSYQVKVTAEAASGRMLGSDWSRPYVIMKPLFAVLPVENLSGASGTPVKQLRQALLERLRKSGLTLLEDDRLDQFMARHRIRHVGGIDTATSRAFLEEAGVNGVLVTSLELYNETDPPKIALTSRLVATGESPKIIWMDGVGLAGDDAPGILDLGLIHAPQVLRDKALDLLVESLTARLAGKTGRAGVKGARRFRPKITFDASFLNRGKRYTIGVLPFIDLSERSHGGEIMALHFVRQLSATDDFVVLEPGVIRERLLALRIIMQEGISKSDLDKISNSLGTDLMLAGKVTRYQDLIVPGGIPTVDFSVMLMEGMDKKIVWSSSSYNRGDDGVFFFDAGRVSTAHEAAARMVRSVFAQIERSRGEPGKEVPHEIELLQQFRRKE